MPDRTILVILTLAAAALIALGLWIILRLRPSPKEREKRRRLAINASGRVVEGTITEANDTSIFYSYSVGGAGYATAQDIEELHQTIGVQPEKLIGAIVSVKYVRSNPANSIVVCEKWSGLRSGKTGGLS